MSRRLGIVLSCLLLLGVAVWMLRGGDEPPASAPKPMKHEALPAERRGDRPPPRDLGAAADAERPGVLHRKQPAGGTHLAPPAAPGGGGPAPPVAPEDDTDLQDTIRVALHDRDPSERAAAIADLSLRDDLVPVEPVIREAANDPDPDVKMAVIAALGQFGEAVPMDVLSRLASDPDPEVRLEVLDLVENLSDEQSIPTLVRPLLDQFARDPNEEVREKAQDVIEELSEPDDSDDLDEAEQMQR